MCLGEFLGNGMILGDCSVSRSNLGLSLCDKPKLKCASAREILASECEIRRKRRVKFALTGKLRCKTFGFVHFN